MKSYQQAQPNTYVKQQQQQQQQQQKHRIMGATFVLALEYALPFQLVSRLKDKKRL